MPLVRVQRPTQDVAQPAQNYGFHASADAWYALTVDDNNELIANTHNRIWDTSALAWVAATGSLAGGSSVEVVNFPSVQQVSVTGTATVVGSVNVKNIAGSNVNPATEDTLSGIATNIATMLGNQTDGDQVVKSNKTPSDTFTNPTDALNAWALLGGWSPATSQWLRMYARAFGADAVAATTDYMLQTRANLVLFNGSTSDRARGDVTNGLDVDVTRLPNVTLASQGNPFTSSVPADTRRGQTLLFASISTAAAGNTALVSADASNKIKIVSYVFVSTGANTVTFNDGTVNLTGGMAVAANGGVSAIGDPSSWLMETAAINRPLNINLSAATQVSGHITYIKEA